MDRPYPQTKAEALLIEREGYAARGLKDRVAEVDAELKAVGGVVVDDRPTEHPGPKATQKLVLSYVGDDKDRAAEALAIERGKGDDANAKFVEKLSKLAGVSASA